MLTDRFPEIAFHLQVGKFVPFELFRDDSGKWNGRKKGSLIYPEGASRKEFDSCRFEELEIVYVIGLGLGDVYFSFKEWLICDPMRVVIFLEDDLAVIDAFLRVELSKEIINNCQVHLHYVVNPDLRKEKLHSLACQFPSSLVEVVAGSGARREDFEEYRLQILRGHTAAAAYFSESLHAHKLSKNLLANLKHLPNAFYINRWRGAFKGIPAVICGAGPSLAKDIEAIRKLENKALVIAGGSAITALTQTGVQPHIALAIDPNPQELRCLENMRLEGVPFIYGNRLYHKIFSFVSGPIGYLSSQTGGVIEAWVEQQLGLDEKPIGPELEVEAFSVTTLALAMCCAFGCDPLILVGVDLAFTGNERYASGVLEKNSVSFEALKKEAKKAEDQPIFKEDLDGKSVLTLVKWVMERASIDAFALKNKKSRFINATRGGLGFLALERMTLDEAVKCAQERDLRKKIEGLIAKTGTQVTEDGITRLVKRLKESLNRSLDLCRKMVAELDRANREESLLPTPKMALYESDLALELIDDCFLHQIGGALEILFAQRSSNGEEEEIEKLKWKFKAYLEVLDEIKSALYTP